MSMNVRGFVLPDIPADLLASYPYAVITKVTTPQGSVFTMAAWKETPVFVDSSLTLIGFSFITANSKSDSAYTFTEDDATSWKEVTENTTIFPLTVGNVALEDGQTAVYEIVWSNVDIYTATAFDILKQTATVGTDIYCPKCLNYNGVWFPELPADVVAEYPYIAVAAVELTGFTLDDVYTILGTSISGCIAMFSKSEFAHVMPGILDETGREYIATLGQGVQYSLGMGGAEDWTLGYEFVAGKGFLSVGLIQQSAYYMRPKPIWANHDVYEITSMDLSTGAFTTGGIFFPNYKDTSRYSLARNLIVHLAANARKKYGRNESLTPEQALVMLEKSANVDDIIEGTVSKVINGSVIKIGASALAYQQHLTEVSFPEAELCLAGAFGSCVNLSNVNLPKVTDFSGIAFANCVSLKKLDLPATTSLGSGEFSGCKALETLILRSTTLCSLTSDNAFSNTPIAAGTGYIYVPSALVDAYKAATSWSTYAAQFRAIEDYPDICGTT